MSLLPSGYELYGGVTPMRLSDANGVPFMSCCAWNSARVFAARVFKGANLEEVPLTPFCTGHISINLGGWWCAVNGKEWFNGPIPGFVPVDGHDGRVDSLISQIAAMGQTIAEMETTLGNAVALDPNDRIALNKLRAFLSIA